MLPAETPCRPGGAPIRDNRGVRWWQAGVLAAAVTAGAAPVRADIVERWFSAGFYPVVQRQLTPLSNAVPFAVFDLLTIAAAAATVAVLAHGARRAWRERRWRPAGAAVGRVLTGAALAYLTFLVVWGLNYRRIPIGERIVLADEAPGAEALRALAGRTVEQLNTLHAGAHEHGWEVEPWRDAGLVAAFASVQRLLSDAPPARPGRLKGSIYGPYFRWASVDGMINPFALEVLGNPDLLPFERPFVAAHEWAHLAGYADEAEANFVGWLICLHSHPAAQYSAWLYLYWQLSGDLDPSARARVAAALAPGPRRDIERIAERVRRGQLPFVREAGWKVYDGYLRANRVEDGIRRYGAVVTLILRARFEEGWRPVRRSPGARSN